VHQRQRPNTMVYQELGTLGEGAYGAVFLVLNTLNATFAAMKRQDLDEDGSLPGHVIREASILRELDHPNIVKLLDVFVDQTNHAINFVHELCDMDLRAFMKLMGPFSRRGLRHGLRQCVDAVDFCHRRRVMHRDLKPQNILVNTANRHMKLADFGLSRYFSYVHQQFTHEVITLWYRGPEILLGTKLYSFAVDIWSLGCIAAEMATGAALFPGDSEIDTLFKIFRKLGTPTETSWPGVMNLPNFSTAFPFWKKAWPWSPNMVGEEALGNAGLDFLVYTLQCNPSSRPTSRRVRNHHLFRPITPELRAVVQRISGMTGNTSVSAVKAAPISLAAANVAPPTSPPRTLADKFLIGLASYLNLDADWI